MENNMNDEQTFKSMSRQITRFVEFYQGEGLAKHKALELALKSVGIDCHVDDCHMRRS